MIDKNFVKDIEIYIYEKFGYRNSMYVNPTCNGCCINIHEKNVKLHFRLLGLKPTANYRFDNDCYAASLETINA